MNKNSVFLKAGFLCAVFLLSVSTARTQERRWPIHYGRHIYDDARVVKGFLLLKNGDTLRGWIKLLPYGLAYPLWPGEGSEVSEIELRNIRYIRLEIPFMKDDHTDLVNLGYKRFLWRRDGQKGNAAIYDNELGANGTMMILVNGEKIVKLYHKMSWILHGGNTDRMVVRFIDKRYKLSMRTKDFQTRQEMIDTILDREVPAPPP